MSYRRETGLQRRLSATGALLDSAEGSNRTSVLEKQNFKRAQFFASLFM